MHNPIKGIVKKGATKSPKIDKKKKRTNSVNSLDNNSVDSLDNKGTLPPKKTLEKTNSKDKTNSKNTATNNKKSTHITNNQILSRSDLAEKEEKAYIKRSEDIQEKRKKEQPIFPNKTVTPSDVTPFSLLSKPYLLTVYNSYTTATIQNIIPNFLNLCMNTIFAVSYIFNILLSRDPTIDKKTHERKIEDLLLYVLNNIKKNIDRNPKQPTPIKTTQQVKQPTPIETTPPDAITNPATPTRTTPLAATIPSATPIKTTPPNAITNPAITTTSDRATTSASAATILTPPVTPNPVIAAAVSDTSSTSITTASSSSGNTKITNPKRRIGCVNYEEIEGIEINTEPIPPTLAERMKAIYGKYDPTVDTTDGHLPPSTRSDTSLNIGSPQATNLYTVTADVHVDNVKKDNLEINNIEGIRSTHKKITPNK